LGSALCSANCVAIHPVLLVEAPPFFRRQFLFPRQTLIRCKRQSNPTCSRAAASDELEGWTNNRR
jgi:hypothetical protein